MNTTKERSAVEKEMRRLLDKLDRPIQHTLKLPISFYGLSRDIFIEDLRKFFLEGIAWLEEIGPGGEFSGKFCIADQKVKSLQEALAKHEDCFTKYGIKIQFEDFVPGNLIRMTKE
jgi:hypothetical protein